MILLCYDVPVIVDHGIRFFEEILVVEKEGQYLTDWAL